MSQARSALVVGPAKCIHNSATFFTNNSFEVKLNTKRFNIRPLGFSQPDVRDEDRVVELEVEPDGRWNAAAIAAFWPYLNATPGASMATSADLPFVAHGADTGLLTVISAYVSKMPSLKFSVKKSMIGSIGFKGIVGTGLDPSDTSAYLTYAASGSTFVDSGFTLTAIKTQPYTMAWGAVTGFTSFTGEEGIDVDFSMETKEIIEDGRGVVDERIRSVGVLVKCKPIGPTAAQILTALRYQGSGNALGRSYQAVAASLTITGADGIVAFTMPKASLVEAGYRFGDDVLRNGEIGFVGNLNVSTGTQSAICTLAAS